MEPTRVDEVGHDLERDAGGGVVFLLDATLLVARSGFECCVT
jgi:hypothetical protein